MYRLYIQITDTWYEVDLGSEKPAMNFQANNIAELKDRQSNYSQALKLPFTNHNCNLFAFTDQIDVVTAAPYRKYNCRLFVDECVIAGPGSYIIITKTNTEFETQILSGNADFFDMIKEKQMSDLDLGSYIFGSKTLDSNFKTTNYHIARASFNGIVPAIGSTSTAYPFAYFENAISKICSDAGYTLVHNLGDISSKAINVCTLNPGADSFTGFEGSATGSGGMGRQHWLIKAGSTTALTETDYSGYALKWMAPNKYSVILSVSIDHYSSYGSEVCIYNKTTETVIYQGDEDFSDTVEVSKNDEIIFWANKTDVHNQDIFHASVTFPTDQIQTGHKLYIAPNIGFDTQFDLFKAFLQLFGLTIDVDNVNKKIYAYTMGKVYENKSIAKDWSKKVSADNGETSYIIGSYGQSNEISFVENTTDKFTDIGKFTVDNQLLEKTKSLFTIPFESGKNIGGLAVIPLEELTDGKYVFKEGKPHIVNISLGGSASHQNIQTYVNTYYTGLISMLTRAKLIEEEVLLEDEDIESFSQFIPVYLGKYGQYFYVNKIKNFVSRKLTKCELVRL